MSSGTLIMSDGTAVADVGTLNVKGNFSHTGGTITETSTNLGNGAINFNGTTMQTYTSGGTVSNTINFTVNSGTYLQMADASTVVTGGGTFTLSSSAKLGIKSSDGITSGGATGNIQVTGIRTFNTGANYIYNNVASQVTGNGLPATVNNLTIDNSAGVSLSASENVSGILTQSSGLLKIGPYTLTVDGNISNVSPDETRMIVLDDGTNLGTLNIKVANNQIYRFYVGDTRNGANFTPAIVTFSAGTSSTSYLALSMIAQKKRVIHISTTDFLNRSWTFTPTNLPSPSYTISLQYVIGDVQGTEDNLWFGKYDGSTWTILNQPTFSSHILYRICN